MVINGTLSIQGRPFENLTLSKRILPYSFMYIVPIAWLYVAIMMAVAEANHPTGTVLGAVITFFLYGVGPVALMVYLMGAPARRRAIKAKDAAELALAQAKTTSVPPDAGSHAPRDAIAPVREEA